jgi:multiple sugar transport system permease protein
MQVAARTEGDGVYQRLARNLSRSIVTEGIWAYVLLIPYLVNLLLFTAGPVIAAFVLSFTHYDLLRPPIPAGFDNYARAFGDRDVQAAFRNTAYYVAAYVPITMIFSLFIAMALNQKIRGIVWYRAAFFIPVVTSGVATAIMWQIVLSKFGIANYLLGFVGFRPVDWWGFEHALGSIIMMGVWGGLGVLMMFWLAALQGIPVHLYEAAAIDGAGWLGKFRHVTLPMLTPMALFLMVLGVIGSFQVFVSTFVITGGGPGNATLTLALLIYQQGFTYFYMGYASALAYMMFVIVFIVTMIQWRLQRYWVFYE